MRFLSALLLCLQLVAAQQPFTLEDVEAQIDQFLELNETQAEDGGLERRFISGCDIAVSDLHSCTLALDQDQKAVSDMGLTRTQSALSSTLLSPIRSPAPMRSSISMDCPNTGPRSSQAPGPPAASLPLLPPRSLLQS